VAALLAVLLSGCVTQQQGGTTGKLGRSVETVVSSLASAEIGLNQDQEGLTLPGTSSTLLEDMLKEVQSAAKDIGKVSPKTALEATRQSRALEMAHEAEQALIAASADQEQDGMSGASVAKDVRTFADLARTFADETQGWTR
jgi:hypothetical protein